MITSIFLGLELQKKMRWWNLLQLKVNALWSYGYLYWILISRKNLRDDWMFIFFVCRHCYFVFIHFCLYVRDLDFHRLVWVLQNSLDLFFFFEFCWNLCNNYCLVFQFSHMNGSIWVNGSQLSIFMNSSFFLFH